MKQENARVEKLKKVCWVCGKVHLIAGMPRTIGMPSQYIDKKSKKVYLFYRYAPLNCWIQHNIKKVHYLVKGNYYACIRAVGNGVCGIATKNKKLVTCKNCIERMK